MADVAVLFELTDTPRTQHPRWSSTVTHAGIREVRASDLLRMSAGFAPGPGREEARRIWRSVTATSRPLTRPLP